MSEFKEFLLNKYDITGIVASQSQKVVQAIEAKDSNYDTRGILRDFKEFLGSSLRLSARQRGRILRLADAVPTTGMARPGKWYEKGARIVDEYEGCYEFVKSCPDIDESKNVHVKTVSVKIVERSFKFVSKSQSTIKTSSGSETVDWGHAMEWIVGFELSSRAPCNGFIVQKLTINNFTPVSGGKDTNEERKSFWEWLGNVELGKTTPRSRSYSDVIDTYYHQFAKKVCPKGVRVFGKLFFISGNLPGYFNAPEQDIQRFVTRLGQQPNPATKSVDFLTSIDLHRACLHHADLKWDEDGSIIWCQTKAGPEGTALWKHRLPQPLTAVPERLLQAAETRF